MQSKRSAGYWIEKLNLAEHPEGGYFAPAFRASEQIGMEGLPDRFAGHRAIISTMYYLLENNGFSAFHRLKPFEIWHFYEGNPLTIYIIEPDGTLIERRLGPDFENGESYQVAVEPGVWFAAQSRGPAEFTLVGCTVAPGFEYQDMEIAARAELLAQFPEHRDIIKKLTRA